LQVFDRVDDEVNGTYLGPILLALFILLTIAAASIAQRR
jgi:hypothetical protein